VFNLQARRVLFQTLDLVPPEYTKTDGSAAVQGAAQDSAGPTTPPATQPSDSSKQEAPSAPHKVQQPGGAWVKQGLTVGQRGHLSAGLACSRRAMYRVGPTVNSCSITCQWQAVCQLAGTPAG
jgi:hypothetical protein